MNRASQIIIVPSSYLQIFANELTSSVDKVNYDWVENFAFSNNKLTGRMVASSYGHGGLAVAIAIYL